MCLVEVHHLHLVDVQAYFFRQGYNVYYNVPRLNNPNNVRTTHGGELVAVKKQFNSMPIDESVYEQIRESSGQPLSVIGAYLRLAQFTIVVCSVYLYASEGLSERNQNILFQLQLIKDILGFPLLIFGDFNMLSSDIEQAGWDRRLGAKFVKLDQGSTLINTESRNIDFFMATENVHQLVDYISQADNTPWSPHVGLNLQLNSLPHSVSGYIHCKPRALPLGEFRRSWDLMEEIQQLGLYTKLGQ